MFNVLCLLCSLSFGKDLALLNAPFNIVGKGWQSFSYGPRNSEIHQAFTVVNEAPVLLRITDLSTPGAAFRLTDNNKRLMATPIPAIDSSKSPTRNPLRALNSNAWSHGHAVLPSGFHQIRVFMRFSPWGGGTGSILAEPAEKCSYESNRYFLVMNQVDWEAAKNVCRYYGGELADLKHEGNLSTSKHARALVEAFTVLRRCKPENYCAWIQGPLDTIMLDEDEFPASVQAISETEGITGPEWEITQMAILCQKL